MKSNFNVYSGKNLFKKKISPFLFKTFFSPEQKKKLNYLALSEIHPNPEEKELVALLLMANQRTLFLKDILNFFKNLPVHFVCRPALLHIIESTQQIMLNELQNYLLRTYQPITSEIIDLLRIYSNMAKEASPSLKVQINMLQRTALEHLQKRLSMRTPSTKEIEKILQELIDTQHKNFSRTTLTTVQRIYTDLSYLLEKKIFTALKKKKITNADGVIAKTLRNTLSHLSHLGGNNTDPAHQVLLLNTTLIYLERILPNIHTQNNKLVIESTLLSPEELVYTCLMHASFAVNDTWHAPKVGYFLSIWALLHNFGVQRNISVAEKTSVYIIPTEYYIAQANKEVAFLNSKEMGELSNNLPKLSHECVSFLEKVVKNKFMEFNDYLLLLLRNFNLTPFFIELPEVKISPSPTLLTQPAISSPYLTKTMPFYPGVISSRIVPPSPTICSDTEKDSPSLSRGSFSSNNSSTIHTPKFSLDSSPCHTPWDKTPQNTPQNTRENRFNENTFSRTQAPPNIFSKKNVPANSNKSCQQKQIYY